MKKEDILKRDILEQVRIGKLEKELAFRIIKQLNNTEKTQSEKSGQKDIAIIGISCRLPKANNVLEYWENLKNGVSGIQDFPKSRKEDVEALLGNSITDSYKAGYIDEIATFDSGFFKISPREALLMEPAQRLLLENIYEAMEDSGYGGKKLNNTITSVFVGRDHLNALSYLRILEDIDLTALTGSFPGILSRRISYVFNLQGASVVLDTTCSSGLVAVHSACKAINNKECTMAIAAGINLMLYPLNGTNRMGQVETYDGNIRVFDKESKGTVWGEGIASMILKPLEEALKDRDNIYAVIKGSAVNNDGATNGITAPNAKRQTDVILSAWRDARVNPASISYMEAHGTGTILGDPIEIKGITDAFSHFTDKKQFCGIGSVKTSIGHTVGASGLASLIKVVLSLKNKELPKSINFISPNPYIDFCSSPLYVNDQTRYWDSEEKRVAGVSAFGFSGTNCHVVLEEFIQMQEINVTNLFQSVILVISAANESSLRKLVSYYISYLKNKEINLNDLCYTAAIGRGHYSHRLAFIINNSKELIPLLEEIKNTKSIKTLKKPNIFYGEHKIVSEYKEKRNSEEINDKEKKVLDEKALRYILGERKKEQLIALCNLYVQGANIEWEKIFPEYRRKISIPTYPFEKTRYWPVRKELDIEDLFYHKLWREVKSEIESKNIDSTILILKGSCPICSDIVAQLKNYKAKVIEVELKSSFHRIQQDNYEMEETKENYIKLFEEINIASVTHIVYMKNIGECSIDLNDLMEYRGKINHDIYEIMSLVKILNQIKSGNRTEFILLSDYVNSITGREKWININNSAIYGFGRTINQEYPRMKCRCIDIDYNSSLEKIAEEIFNRKSDYITAFRENKKYGEELEELDIHKTTPLNFQFKEQGVYIITGGLGSIGLRVASYLSDKGKLNLILLSRKKIPASKDWDEIIQNTEDKELRIKIKTLKDIERKGINLECISSDICEEETILQLVKQLKLKYGRINGIFHAAGIMDTEMINNKTEYSIEQVLNPKVIGTLILHKAVEKESMDFFVLFSSVVSLIGGRGQSDYTAANCFLDSFADYRNGLGKRTISINWPAWIGTKMAVKSDFDENKQIFNALFPEQAIKILDIVLHKSLSRVVAGRLNDSNDMIYYMDMISIKLSEKLKTKFNRGKINQSNQQRDKVPYDINVTLKGNKDEIYNQTEEILAQIWANALGLKEIDIHENFSEMGGDSLQAIRLVELIDERFPNVIDISDIYANPSVFCLAHYMESVWNKVSVLHKEAIPDSDSVISDQDLMNLIKNVKSGKETIENGIGTLS